MTTRQPEEGPRDAKHKDWAAAPCVGQRAPHQAAEKTAKTERPSLYFGKQFEFSNSFSHRCRPGASATRFNEHTAHTYERGCQRARRAGLWAFAGSSPAP